MHAIETERLVLSELMDADRGPLVDMLRSESVMRLLFGGTPMTPDEAKAFIDENFYFGRLDNGLGALCEKDTGRFVGFAGLLRCRYLNTEDFEIGVALLENCWHRGYGAEIGRAEITYGFDKLGANRLLALAHPQNIGSLKIIEGLGMHFVKEITTEKRGPRCVYVINQALKPAGENRKAG